MSSSVGPAQSPVKSWINLAVDLFQYVATANEIFQGKFEKQVKDLAKAVSDIAYVGLNIKEKNLGKLAHDAYGKVLSAQHVNPLSKLVSTQLFRLLIATRLDSLNPSDDEYYLVDVVPKLLRELEKRTHKDFKCISDSHEAMQWLSFVTQTNQSPKERSKLRMTMKLIPTDFYDSTLQKRMEIGQTIETATICRQVSRLMKQKKSSHSISKVALDIYNRYVEECIKPAPVDVQEHLRSHFAISLKIRARQLPS